MTKQLRSVLCLMAASVCAWAQGPQPLTTVAIFKVKPGKTADWVAVMKGVYAPMLDQLLKDGVILGYGADMDVAHQAGKPNASAWITMADWAAFEKVEKAIEEVQRKNPGQMVRAMEATDPEAHSDLVLRSPVSKMKAPPAGALPVTSYTMITLKAGKEDAFMKLSKEFDVPVLDQLMADGVIYGYGMDQEVEHTMPVRTRVQWIVMPSLGSRDKVDAAFRAARMKLSEDGRRTLRARYEEVMEAEHKDWTAKSVVFATK